MFGFAAYLTGEVRPGRALDQIIVSSGAEAISVWRIAEGAWASTCAGDAERWSHQAHALLASDASGRQRTTGGLGVVVAGALSNLRVLVKRMATAGILRHQPAHAADILAALVAVYLERGRSPHAAAEAAFAKLQGSFAAACVFPGEQLLVATSRAHPLAVGGNGECCLVAASTKIFRAAEIECRCLEMGDLAVLRPGEIVLIDAEGMRISKQLHRDRTSPVSRDLTIAL